MQSSSATTRPLTQRALWRSLCWLPLSAIACIGCDSGETTQTTSALPPQAAVAGAPATAAAPASAEAAPKAGVMAAPARNAAAGATPPSAATTSPTQREAPASAAAPATGSATQPTTTQPTTAQPTTSQPTTSQPTTPPQDQPGNTPTQVAPHEPAAGSGFVRGPMPTQASASKAGPYQVGTIKDGFRDGPDFGPATIYYPEDAEPPFAMIVFCPGWLSTQADDAAWGPFIASHGIVFMLIDTNTVSDSVLQREAAELDAWDSLKGEQTRADSPLKGKLALDRVGLMGWSMGGGGAWLNGIKHPELKTIVTLAGHNATAGGAEPVRELSVPTLMLAGTADTTILGLGMSQPVYDVIPDATPKLLYEVEGADHFDFNNPAYADGAPARFALSWQKVYLEGDMRYYSFLLEKGPGASDFRSNLK